MHHQKVAILFKFVNSNTYTYTVKDGNFSPVPALLHVHNN